MTDMTTHATLASILTKSWQNTPLAIKGIVVILLPLSLLLASIGFLYNSEQQLSSLENKLKTALQNQRDIQTIHTQLLEASTAVRDFLLTGDKQFLVIFHRAEQQLPNVFIKLAPKLENQKQKERLNKIKPLVEQNLRNLDALAANESDIASDYLITQFKRQVSSLGKLRKEIEALNNQEAALVSEDQKKVALERERNFRITLFAVVAGIIGSFFAVWIFSDTIVKKVRLLRDSASHLAKAEPLNLPAGGRDELGQLSNALDQASHLLADNIYKAKQATFEAERANQSKSMFLSRTSHELRTPLNAILGFAQLLQSDLPEGQALEKVDLIKSAGDHLLKLIDEVLDIAKIEAGEQSIEMKVVSINDLLAEAIHYISPLGKVRDIEIKHHIEDHLFGQADEQKLLQVVLNVLSNALKYGPAESTVNVKGYQQSQHIIIEILDEGTGIPTELRSRLFTPFDRLGAEQSNIEGTGLGLALSKKIMTAMHGDIEVAEQQSLFSISLAASAKKQKPAPISTPTIVQQVKQDQPQSKQHSIIYIEDNVSNKALVEAIIGRLPGYQLITGNNLHEARNLLQELEVSLLMIDLNLPDGSGETLVDEVLAKQYGQPIPMMVLSADATPQTMHRLKQLGVQSYLTKPFNIAEFTQAVQSLIEHHQN